MAVSTRALAAGDRDDWERLFQEYATFYKVEQSQVMRDTVWEWLHDATALPCGIVAEQDGEVVGFTHYRPFTSTLKACTNGFLDDLFVAPGARGSGAAAALIEAVCGEGRARGWKTIRWITAEDNYRARGLYDRVAVKTPWVTYDIPL